MLPLLIVDPRSVETPGGVLLSQGLVDIPAALWVSSGSIVGGYVTARVMQRLDPRRLRRLVVVLGFLLCAWFFARALAV